MSWSVRNSNFLRVESLRQPGTYFDFGTGIFGTFTFT